MSNIVHDPCDPLLPAQTTRAMNVLILGPTLLLAAQAGKKGKLPDWMRYSLYAIALETIVSNSVAFWEIEREARRQQSAHYSTWRKV